MRITIEIQDGVRWPGGASRRSSQLQLPEGATVDDALECLGIDRQGPWNAAIDGRLAAGADRLREGARLVVFAAIEGG